MADEKYIGVDPKTGKPEYIDKEEAAKQGIPKDEDLCNITFGAAKVSKIVEGKQTLVDGFKFECAPSDKCLARHKEELDRQRKLNGQKTAQEGEIAAQQRIIDAKGKLPDDGKKKKKKTEDEIKEEAKQAEKRVERAKEKKAAAETELGEINKKLAAIRPLCSRQYFGDGGAKGALSKEQFTADGLLEMKIQFIFCLCRAAPKDDKGKKGEKKP